MINYNTSSRRHLRSRRLTCALTASAIALISGGAANACYTVTLENDARKDIKVLWSAAGCAGEEHWTPAICEHKTVKAKTSASYDYKWGTTAPKVILYEKVNGFDEIEHNISYRMKGGRFVHEDGDPESAPSCGKHYTIKFSQADMDANF